MARLNVQAEVIAYLKSALDVPVSVFVPTARSRYAKNGITDFVTVHREGGSRQNRLVDRAGVGIEMWASTESKAAKLAEQVSDLILDLEYRKGFARVEEESLYSDADADSGSPRWYGSYTITTYQY